MAQSPRTTIDALSPLGHELSDDQLRLAAGGRVTLTYVGKTGANNDYVDDPPPDIG